MQIQEVFQLVRPELIQVEEEIQKRLAVDNPLIANISQHICNSGGKRLRPMLLLLCSKLCNYQGSKDIFYGCIMEFVHVATLLHDDVIDGSETRRGTYSANAKWGDNIPVLVGDYLYGMSNVMLVEGGFPKAFERVSFSIMSMAEGEVLETLKKSDLGISEEEYFDIIIKKTAVFFSACAQTGAILEQKGEEYEQALASYGMNLGIAFQMMDDVLDFVAEERKLGKPLGNDLREGKLTIPVIKLLQQASQPEQERIRQIIEKPQGSKAELDFILQLLDHYQIIPAVVADARSYVAKAKQSLQIFDDSVYRRALLVIADYVVNREN